MIGFLISLLISSQPAAISGLREVKATSCEIVPIKVALGMTTQLIFEQEPKLTLFAEEGRFQIGSNPQAPRSLAIIPRIPPEEVQNLVTRAKGEILSNKEITRLLNDAFQTNLFVLFEGEDQFLLKLRIVEKQNADLIVKIQRKFSEKCLL